MKTLLIFNQLLDEIRTMEDVYYGSYSEVDKKIHTASSGRSNIISSFNNFSTVNLCYENDFCGSIKNKSFFFCLNPKLFNFNLIILLDTHIAKQPNLTSEDLSMLGIVELAGNRNSVGEGSLISRLLLVSKHNDHPTYFISRRIELARWNSSAVLRRPGNSIIFKVGCPFCGPSETALNRDKNIFDILINDVVNVLLNNEQDQMNILSFIDELNDWVDYSAENKTDKDYATTSETVDRSDK